jgi:multidrug efflux pump subunit AcrA (membrane-fusion protein)
MRILFTVLSCAAVILGTPAIAHEGHDHNERSLPQVANVLPRAESSSDTFELVVTAKDGQLLIWLDRFATNEPVEGATIEVETPAGPATATARTGEAYRLEAPWLAKPGRYDLIVTVTLGSDTDILPVTLDTSPRDSASLAVQTPGNGRWRNAGIAAGIAAVLGFGALVLSRRRRRAAIVLVAAVLASGAQTAFAHEGHDHGAPAPSITRGDERAQRQPDGTIFVPKSVQRIFGIRTIITKESAHRRSIELPGRIIPDPNASGYVQTSVGGRLSAPPGGFLRLGMFVKVGDVLAYVTPPIQAIDVSTMRQQQGELDQQLAVVERRLARYETLAPSGAVPRAQLEDTRTELQGLRDRRKALDTIRREPEALVAPVSGVIAEGTPVAGQMAQPGAVIFHIVEPKHLWIEALSFDAIAGAEGAFALTSTGRRLALGYRGSGFADRSQSIPVHFAIEDDTADLRAGQFVTVLVATRDEKQGIAIPRSAVVRASNGQDFVFEHIAAELYAPRPVRIEPLDGQNVLVATGLQSAKRVVVQGAELLDHVR